MNLQRIAVIVSLIVVGLGIGLSAEALLTVDTVPRIGLQELKRRMGSPNLVIIDVRTRQDCEESTAKIKGSIREDSVDVDSWMARYPATQTLVFYCA